MPRERPPRDEGFAKRLREVMDRERVRPKDLAKGQHVNPVTVSRWRRGEVPDDLRLPLLAARLRTTVEYLQTGQGSSTASEPGPVAPSQANAPAALPVRAADRAAQQILTEAIAALSGGGTVSKEEALGWVLRAVEARKARPNDR